jgi:hypothetical protein
VKKYASTLYTRGITSKSYGLFNMGWTLLNIFWLTVNPSLTASKAIIIAPSPWTLEAGPGSRTMTKKLRNSAYQAAARLLRTKRSGWVSETDDLGGQVNRPT